MKKTIISMLAASFLASFGSAQVWVQGSTDTNLDFIFRSVADPGVIGNQYDSMAGAEVVIDLTPLGNNFTLTFTILNLSGLTNVNVAPSTTVDFGPGTITGFGFNVIPSFDNVTLSPHTGWVIGNPPASPDGSFHPAAYDFEVGATTTNGNNDSITSGAQQSFEFNFTTGSDQSGLTLDDLLDTNANGWEFAFRFQSTSGAGSSDKVAINREGGGGGGFGFVPEPSTYGMFGALALLGLMVVRQVRRR